MARVRGGPETQAERREQMSSIDNVLVIGAGQMGAGIANVAAQSSCHVWLADIDQATASRGRERVVDALDKAVRKGKLNEEEKRSISERIAPIGDLSDAASAQIAIEAVSENEAVKRSVLGEVDRILPEEAIVATNTSSISITRLARATQRGDRFIGMHFMNPVPVMSLVEVIRGEWTSDETYVTTKALAERLGKVVVTASDYPGFIVNRILMPMINEAAYALMEGVATAEDLDTAMRLGTNQPMGPLTLADFIGLDTCLAILEVLHQGLGDPKYRPCPLLRRLVEAGKLGRKAAAGFYNYT